MAAGATSIGINFVGKASSSFSEMDPAETAGAVPQPCWNNALGGTGTLAGLLDQTGTPTAAAVTWRGNYGFLTIANTPGDARLMRGYLTMLGADPVTVTVAGMAGAAGGDPYDVLVYFDGRNGATAWPGLFTVGPQVRPGTDPAGHDFAGAFVLDAGSGGNYVRFAGLTGDGFTLTAAAAPGGGSVAVNALQIVYAPEPAAVTLMALGLAAVAIRRGRARTARP